MRTPAPVFRIQPEAALVKMLVNDNVAAATACIVPPLYILAPVIVLNAVNWSEEPLLKDKPLRKFMEPPLRLMEPPLALVTMLRKTSPVLAALATIFPPY